MVLTQRVMPLPQQTSPNRTHRPSVHHAKHPTPIEAFLGVLASQFSPALMLPLYQTHLFLCTVRSCPGPCLAAACQWHSRTC